MLNKLMSTREEISDTVFKEEGNFPLLEKGRNSC